MEREMTDRERRDRAARAATADRDEMATAIEGFRREREFLRAKLRDAAAREEREMEREMERERGGGDDDDSDEESPGGSAPRNTPARQMDPRARAARLAADLRDASSGGASSGGGDVVGTPNGDETSSAPSGFFHFVSRSANGARATGGATVGDVGEDQLRLVDSIHELLSEVERERARAKRALEAAGENARTLEATNAALERRLAGKRELQAEGAAETRDASENVSRGAVGGSDASDASDSDDSDDSDAWSDDDVGTTPRRRRGFFSSLNPFARR
jgi:hypothetical protein